MRRSPVLGRASSERIPVIGWPHAAPDAATHLARYDEICAAGDDWRGRARHVELARDAVAAARDEGDTSPIPHITGR